MYKKMLYISLLSLPALKAQLFNLVIYYYRNIFLDPQHFMFSARQVHSTLATLLLSSSTRLWPGDLPQFIAIIMRH